LAIGRRATFVLLLGTLLEVAFVSSEAWGDSSFFPQPTTNNPMTTGISAFIVDENPIPPF
jgi:hypothetical protein